MKKTLLLNYLKAAYSRNPRKNKTRFNGLLILFVMVMGMGVSWGQTSYTSTSATGAWNTSRWNNSSNTSPYTSSFTSNNAVNFASGTYTFAGMGATVNVGNVTVASNVTVNFTSTGNTFATGGSVRTFNIGNGGLFDFNGNSISTTTGTGFIKSGAGVFATGVGAFTGGFTINQGTVIARGTTGLGSGTGNLLTLNGGTIASNATRSFDNTRFPGGIVIGGDVQFGEMDTAVSLANSTANLSFANNVSLGNSLRILTLGNGGTITFSGIISNTASTGINFAANANGTGKFVLTGANTYTGNTTVLGGTLQLNKSGGTTIPTTNTITVSGGTLQISSNQTLASLDITSGTVQIDSGVTLTIDGNVSIPSGVNLILNGVLTSTGTRTLTIASGANVTIGNTSGLATATGTFSGGKTFTTGANYIVSVATTTPLGVDVSANNFSTTESITLNSALSVSGSLSFGNVNSKTITTDGNLTLKSTSSGTAYISDITNGGANSGNTISGNVTVERYIPAKRAWRALTAPLKGSDTSIFSQWQNSGTISSGIGVELWGPGGTGSSGNGLAVGPSSSILQYGSGVWNPIENTKTSNLFTTSGNNTFMIFPTGGYGSGNIASSSTATATTLRATGQLIMGDVPFTGLSSSHHTLIGNPYASPINLNSILDANATLEKLFWVWDPNGANQGAYNMFDADANSYNVINLSYTNSTVIQSGQAFFVKALSGQTGSFTISESNKSTSSTNNVFRNNNPAQLLRIGLYKQENNEWSGRDGAMTVILPDANANQSPNKMANGTENVAFVKNGSLFASEHHLPLVASDVLNIRVWRTTAGANYKLKINTEQFATTNLSATLEDLFTNSRTPLNLEGTAVEYPFTVTTDVLSTGDRFRIVFQNAVLGTNNPTATSFSIVPNPVTGDSFQVNLGTLATGIYSYSICNAIGQEVEKGILNNVTQNTNYEVKMSNSATGIYIMKIKGNDNTVFTAKIIKK